MTISITPKPLKGAIRAPGSKSATHRALICAALAGGARFWDASICDDTNATIGALRELGATVEEEGEILSVSGELTGREDCVIDCCASGSTLRFMLPVALALGGTYRFKGSEKLMSRRHDALFAALDEEGVEIVAQKDSIFACGKLTARRFVLDASISSQYISGFLFCLPMLGDGAELEVIGDKVSQPYIEMTVRTMAQFGVTVTEDDGIWRAQGKYAMPEEDIFIEGDWSAAAFWLAAAAINGNITVEGLMTDTAQGDSQMVALLGDMGGDSGQRSDSATASKSRLQALSIDVTDVPDLVPALCVTACFAKGETRIYGAGRLRTKESDRLAAISTLIIGLGGDATVTPDGIIIKGEGLVGGRVDAINDHRIAMAAAAASVGCSEPVILQGAECVAKSYPAFWDDFIELGGEFEETE